MNASPDDPLARYAEAVEASPHNLLSRRGLAELRDRHVPECVALAGMLPSGPARLVDVGSGGGLPGLVVAIMRPDLEVTLVESTQKKARFLTETAAALGIGVEVLAERAEAVGARSPGGFDLATARAVAPLERLLPLTLPLLRPGGLLYAVKGRRWREELEAARAVLAEVGASVVTTPDDVPGAPSAPKVVIIAASNGVPAAGTGDEGA